LTIRKNTYTEKKSYAVWSSEELEELGCDSDESETEEEMQTGTPPELGSKIMFEWNEEWLMTQVIEVGQQDFDPFQTCVRLAWVDLGEDSEEWVESWIGESELSWRKLED
jgi:hypothetical protein